jgi:sulfur-carrier protein
MKNVKVKFYATLRKKAGKDELSCRASSVHDAIACIKEEFGPEFIRVMKSCNIFLNSDNITMLQGPLTRLKEGDTLHIFPPMGGG